MSSSYSPTNGNKQYSSQSVAPVVQTGFSGDISADIAREESIARRNVPLVIATASTCLLYSYFGIDRNMNNAINRSLLMALSTFLGASVTSYAKTYFDLEGNSPMYLEAATIPLIYYYVSKRQFQLPDLDSQAIKTGVISSIVGEISTPMATKYYDGWLLSRAFVQNLQ